MNNIEKIRKSLGLSQQEFADKLGVTRSAISQYESGKREMPLYIEKLIDALFFPDGLTDHSADLLRRNLELEDENARLKSALKKIDDDLSIAKVGRGRKLVTDH